MKLTNELKWYIRTRLEELVSPVHDAEFAKLRKDAKECEKKLTAEVEKLIAKTVDEFVKDHPEAQGIKAVFANTCPLQIEFDATGHELSDRLRKAEFARMKRIDRLETLAHLDVQNCKGAIELDEALVKLASHSWGVVPSPCAGHTTPLENNKE